MTIFALAENSIQLVPDGTILIHLLIVVGMVFILNRTLFRPLNKVLAERDAQTSGRLDEAKNFQADLDRKLAKYERGLREARTSAYQLVEKERAQAVKQREQQLTTVRDEVRALVSQEKSEIDQQVEEARKAIALESIKSAMQIGSQILHRPIEGTSQLTN